ncbi:hypothetical protein OV320_5573 [Actinobacteria bacterium OV320]|nr:hypothetical protein OV320_5573 [Actinobacteria bacterium OV320]
MIKMPYRPVRVTCAAVAVPEAGFPSAECRVPSAEGRASGAGHTAAPAGRDPAGAEVGVAVRQLRDARASFQVADGRMNAAAFAGSGW